MENFRVIAHILKPHKLLYAGILVVTICASALESLGLAAFFPVFSSLLENQGDELEGILGVVTALVNLMPFPDFIVSAGALLVGLFVLGVLFNLLREGMIALAGGKVLYDVKRQTMERYAGAHYQFFLDNKQGSLMYNVMSAPTKAAQLALSIPQIMAELFKIIAIVIVLTLIAPVATFVLVSVGVVYFWTIRFLGKKVSYNIGNAKVQSGIEQTVIGNEFLSGIRQIIAFGTGGRWLGKFERENRSYSDRYTKDLFWVAVPRNAMELTTIVLMMGLLLALWFTNQNAFAATLPKLGIFGVAMLRLLPSVTTFGRRWMEIMGSLPDTELIYHALNDPIPRRHSGPKVLESFDQTLKFENVSFAYPGREPLLSGVNLVLKKGEVTALVGPSGAGKTTIINLILGLFEPTEGCITVDGVPLDEYNTETWLNKIGLVSQDPFIYHGTVAENIDFGRKSHSLESIITAAKVANAHGFISELPQGYDTIVGDRGMKLSGGQQQRITIARAVLDEPELLIFDEATSSLDSISEKLVQEAIDRVSKDRTVIIIAHRLSTIRYADKIVVLDRGRVLEEGSHQELLEQDGHYSRLVAASR